MSYCTTRAFEVQAFFKFGPVSYEAVKRREWVMATSLYCIFCRVLNKKGGVFGHNERGTTTDRHSHSYSIVLVVCDRPQVMCPSHQIFIYF